ncbi:hypothetical protein [Ruegeria sp. HKCCA6837]|uniref:hypothetical protein n=1 Tax=Ruegeria sp. HKCCA6837 TaxID=2682989 RepID=UPI0014890444|nr:hypothetical protein [Ruegeria sp. HKCCA6837]
MLRSSLAFILCGTLAACSASAERDLYTFDAKTNAGEDVLMVCVKDPAQEVAEQILVGDYQLLADGRSYLTTIKFHGKFKKFIASPIDAEPCKSLIEKDSYEIERDADISAGEAAKVTAAILLGIPICILTSGDACP